LLNGNHIAGKHIYAKVYATDSITIPSDWVMIGDKPQEAHVNVMQIYYASNGDVLFFNQVVDKNLANAIELDTSATSFVTPDNFWLTKIKVNVTTKSSISLGTGEGLTDILEPVDLLPGENTINNIDMYFKYAARIYINCPTSSSINNLSWKQ
jgi:hypothetical protein